MINFVKGFTYIEWTNIYVLFVFIRVIRYSLFYSFYSLKNYTLVLYIFLRVFLHSSMIIFIFIRRNKINNRQQKNRT